MGKTLKEAILSERRHKRPHMEKWIPLVRLVDGYYQMIDKEKGLFLPCVKFGYSPDDVVRQDWEIEGD